MAFLSAAELRKYDWRPEVLIKKLKEKTPFETKTSKSAVLRVVHPERNWEGVIRSGSNTDLSKLIFVDDKGNTSKLSEIVKTTEFGGKGAGSGTAKEDMALKSLREQMEEVKIKEASSIIKIKIGTKIYNAYDVISTPGTPKSDFHLIDPDGNEIVWISHKDGRTEKDFQQWGGMSQRTEPEIYSHRESQSLIADIKKLFPEGLPSATTIARKISDNRLKNMSVYGNRYGGPFGRQNVTITLQGSVVLSKTGSLYTISALHTHLNGDNLTGGYEPVFMAIYKGDRSDFGIKGTRVVIAPLGSRKIKAFI